MTPWDSFVHFNRLDLVTDRVDHRTMYSHIHAIFGQHMSIYLSGTGIDEGTGEN